MKFPSKSEKPRMRDIALEAGVSIGTVSRVLNGKFDVAPELGERVREVAQRLGYARRSGSRSLLASRAALGTIAYLVQRGADQVATDPFQHHFLEGIEKEAQERGGHVLFSSCGEDVERDTVPSMIAKKLVTGVIIKGFDMDDWLRKIGALVPAVLLMSEESSRVVPSVSCDNRQGTFQILRHLHGLGHRRIGLFDEHLGAVSVLHRERLAAFLEYAPRLGIDAPPENLQVLSREGGAEGNLFETTERALRHFLALGERRPTAIICVSDFHAFALQRIAFSLGLRVPQDLSVVGFMNTPPCEHSSPPLTSVDLHGKEIGRVAVEMLQERIKDPLAPSRHVTIGTELMVRQSTAPPPA